MPSLLSGVSWAISGVAAYAWETAATRVGYRPTVAELNAKIAAAKMRVATAWDSKNETAVPDALKALAKESGNICVLRDILHFGMKAKEKNKEIEQQEAIDLSEHVEEKESVERGPLEAAEEDVSLDDVPGGELKVADELAEAAYAQMRTEAENLFVRAAVRRFSERFLPPDLNARVGNYGDISFHVDRATPENLAEAFIAAGRLNEVLGAFNQGKNENERVETHKHLVIHSCPESELDEKKLHAAAAAAEKSGFLFKKVFQDLVANQAGHAVIMQKDSRFSFDPVDTVSVWCFSGNNVFLALDKTSQTWCFPEGRVEEKNHFGAEARVGASSESNQEAIFCAEAEKVLAQHIGLHQKLDRGNLIGLHSDFSHKIPGSFQIPGVIRAVYGLNISGLLQSIGDIKQVNEAEAIQTLSLVPLTQLIELDGTAAKELPDRNGTMYPISKSVADLAKACIERMASASGNEEVVASLTTKQIEEIDIEKMLNDLHAGISPEKWIDVEGAILENVYQAREWNEGLEAAVKKQKNNQ